MVRLDDERGLVLTTDFFPPVVDDPYLYGKIAATNALSDVYAMGGRPFAVLNLVAFPAKLDLEILGRILAGARDQVHEAGAFVAGGHSVEDPNQVSFGLAVTGLVPKDRIIRNRGMRPGDVLVLTKPLGSGLISTSIRKEENTGPEVDEAIRWMTTLNGIGQDAILAAAPHAMTDVTGYGLVGHLSEMLGDDALEVVVDASALPRMVGVERCFRPACRGRSERVNEVYAGERLHFEDAVDEWDRVLLCDPQTSGGLLIALPEERARLLVEALRATGKLERTTVIGRVHEAEGPRLRVRA